VAGNILRGDRMVIERFKNSDPVPVYRRFREYGRLAPDGLRYVSSWVEAAHEKGIVHRDPKPLAASTQLRDHDGAGVAGRQVDRVHIE
jgi:Domain of unknown function (DUF3303)